METCKISNEKNGIRKDPNSTRRVKKNSPFILTRAGTEMLTTYLKAVQITLSKSIEICHATEMLLDDVIYRLKNDFYRNIATFTGIMTDSFLFKSKRLFIVYYCIFYQRVKPSKIYDNYCTSRNN